MKHCYIDKEHRAIADLVPGDDIGLLVPGMVLTRINVPIRYRGKGIGSRLLCRVLDDADREKVTLYLELLPSGGLSYADLKAWYQRHGFHMMPGGHLMCRPPKEV